MSVARVLGHRMGATAAAMLGRAGQGRHHVRFATVRLEPSTPADMAIVVEREVRGGRWTKANDGRMLQNRLHWCGGRVAIPSSALVVFAFAL